MGPSATLKAWVKSRNTIGADSRSKEGTKAETGAVEKTATSIVPICRPSMLSRSLPSWAFAKIFASMRPPERSSISSLNFSRPFWKVVCSLLTCAMRIRMAPAKADAETRQAVMTARHSAFIFMMLPFFYSICPKTGFRLFRNASTPSAQSFVLKISAL